MAQSANQGEGGDRQEGWLRRCERRLRDLSLLAKSAAVLSVSLAIMGSLAFGSGTVRVSGDGIEVGSRREKPDDPEKKRHAERGYGGITYNYFLQPQIVRICPMARG